MFDYLINLQSIFLLLAFFLNLALSLVIYFKNRKDEVNRSFSAMLFGIAFWTGSLFAFLLVKDLNWILFIRRITPIGSSLLVGYFLYFSFLFPDKHNPLPRLQRYLMLVPGYVFSFFSISTSFMIKKIFIIDLHYPFLGMPEFGFLYKLYAIYFVAYFILAISVLIYKYKNGSGKERVQLWYVLFGTAFAGGGGILLSLLLPILGIPYFFTVGPIFSLLLAGFIYYAIVRHKLLGVDVFLSRGFYALIGLMVAAGSILVVISGNMAFLPVFFLILIQIILGFIVLFKDARNEINISFAFFTFNFSILSYFAYMVTKAELSGVIFYNKYIFVVAALALSFFMYFSVVFPAPKKNFNIIKKILIFIFPAILFFLALFDLIIKDVVLDKGVVILVFGQAYPLFVVFALFYMIASLHNFITGHKNAKSIEKKQSRYMFLGMGLTFIFLIIAKLILLRLGYDYFIVFGLYSVLFFMAFTSYAIYSIIKHRLIGVEIIIQKGIIYSIVSSLIMGIYAFIILMSEQFFKSFLGYTSIIISTFIALGFAIVFQPLVRYLHVLTNKFFLHGKYDYQKKLRLVSQKITTQIRMEDMAKLMATTFIDEVKVEQAALLFLDKEKQRFCTIPLKIKDKYKEYREMEINLHSPVPDWLLASKDALLLDELQDEISKQKKYYYEEGQMKLKSLLTVKEELDKFGGTLWVPVLLKNDLVGIIFLGEKKSGDNYTAEDIELLTVLAGQIAIALENTAIYEEVLSIKNYIQDILDAMTSGVLTVDIFGRIITFNPMAEKITKLSAEEIIGRNYKEVFSSKSAIYQTIEATFHNKYFVDFETSLVSSEKNLIPVSLSNTLLRDSQGKKTGVLLVMADLMELKVLRDKARQADKVTAFGTMAAGMAHEIKNPLSSMKVLAQLLPTKYDETEFKNKIIEIMPREINRIDRIVESLLGFARATSPKFIAINLNQLIAQSVEHFNHQAESAKVKIIPNYGQIPQIEADPDQLMQIFVNLILNAIQSMASGGELKISTSQGRKIENILENVKVEMEDTGHGISADGLNKLFDPFFTTKYAGTGLGLTIAHSIVDSHGGTIEVQSVLGKGSIFTIYLPVKQAFKQ